MFKIRYFNEHMDVTKTAEMNSWQVLVSLRSFILIRQMHICVGLCSDHGHEVRARNTAEFALQQINKERGTSMRVKETEMNREREREEQDHIL